MYQVDLNSDLGESFGAYTIGLDQDVIAHVSSANIACGYHAGDPLVMDRTVAACKAAGVAVGAHPGYPDLMGFGRRNMVVSPKEVKAYVKYQLGALMAFAAAEGIRLQHCKPHGALYNMAGKDMDLALAIAEEIAEGDKNIILLGLANSKMIDAGKQLGLRVANEVFADRAYQADFPNELIQWQMQRDALEGGYRYFDFRGVEGYPVPENPYYGLHHYKQGFGAQFHAYVGQCDRVLHPMRAKLVHTLQKIFVRE